MKKDFKYFGFIFWVHLILVSFAYLSPFLFDWKIIIIGTILLLIQYRLIGGCFLNKVQFDNTEDVTFLYPYLKMLGLNLNPQKFKLFIRYYFPIILIVVALLWQVVLDKQALLF